jgi:hypothetical protein
MIESKLDGATLEPAPVPLAVAEPPRSLCLRETLLAAEFADAFSHNALGTCEQIV